MFPCHDVIIPFSGPDLADGWRDHDTLVIDPGVTLDGSWVAGLHGTTIPVEEVIMAVRAGIEKTIYLINII